MLGYKQGNGWHTFPPFSFFLLALAPDLDVRCGFLASFVRDSASDMMTAALEAVRCSNQQQRGQSFGVVVCSFTWCFFSASPLLPPDGGSK